MKKTGNQNAHKQAPTFDGGGCSSGEKMINNIMG